MSAILGMNRLSHVSWKGQSFTQITSKIQKNQININNITDIIYRARPLPIYRREIASTQTIKKYTGSSRISSKISSFEQPGGYLVNVSPSNKNNKLGIENILDKQLIKPINQLNEKYCHSNIPFDNKNPNATKCLSSQNNALRKMRSSGMIKPKYYSSTNQFLYNRKKTFEQNQFNYLKSGNKNAIPGSPASFTNNNIYTNGGGVFNTKENGKLLNCSVIYKPSNYNYSINGAVCSSTRMDRIKYNTLNDISSTYKGVYGTAMESSFANGVPSPGYNIKNIIGYSLTKVPVIMNNGNIRKCEFVRIKR